MSTMISTSTGSVGSVTKTCSLCGRVGVRRFTRADDESSFACSEPGPCRRRKESADESAALHVAAPARQRRQKSAPARRRGPRAIAPPTDQGWRSAALCAQTDPEIFFPERGRSTREAKMICWGCPVREACLDDALATGEGFGVRGGLSERERRRLVRQRAA